MAAGLLAASIFAIGPRSAAAETAPAAKSDAGSREDRVIELLNAERAKPNGLAYVVVGVAFRSTCNTLRFGVGRVTAGKYENVYTLNSVGLSFFRIVNWLGKGMPAGNYVIGWAKCEASNVRLTLNGPHAQFQVRPGEVVDVGLLVFDTKGVNLITKKGTVERSIKKTQEDRLKIMREKLPRTMQRLVERPMTLNGPALMNVKDPNSLF